MAKSNQLDAVTVRTAKAGEKDVFMADGSGLFLRISPAGSKSWVYHYKDKNRKSRWMSLGAYPSMSLAEARVAAAEQKALRRKGVDPVEERQRQKALLDSTAREKAARITVKELFERWHRAEVSQRSDKGLEVRRMFGVDVLPVIGHMAAEDVRKSHVAQIIDNVLERGIEGSNKRMAVVVLAGVRQMYNFAIERDLVESDPTSAIRKSRIHSPSERERVLSQGEIRLLAQLLPKAGLARQSELSIWAMLATACRVGELSKAEVAHVDLEAGTWLIPAEIAKNRRKHTVFLSGFAQEVFRELRERAEALDSEWLLPATNKVGPVCEKSLTKQLTDRQRGDVAPLKGRTPRSNALVLPDGKWRSHDLRRSAATLMGELGVRPDVIEKCLNHVEPNRMRRTYQRHSAETEMRDAWSRLGERLELLTKEVTNLLIIERVA